MKKLILLFIFSISFACKEDKKNSKELPLIVKEEVTLKYAQGFLITKFNTFSILEIKMPWPNAKQPFKFLLINKEDAAKATILRSEYDGIIMTPVQNIICTSTTHLPALELLNVEQTLVGFPGTDYVSSTTIRQLIDSGKVRELGKNEALNTEVLLELNPDVVIGFGIDGGNRSLETIKKSEIPVIFIGDWVESSPLAKAEWIKFFGALYDKEKEADSVFNQIEEDYLKAKKLAQNTKSKPTVLSLSLIHI